MLQQRVKRLATVQACVLKANKAPYTCTIQIRRAGNASCFNANVYGNSGRKNLYRPSHNVIFRKDVGHRQIYKQKFFSTQAHRSPVSEGKDDLGDPHVERKYLLSEDISSNSIEPLVLRDWCQCPQCVDPSTKQKLFQTSDIPPNIELRHANFKNKKVSTQWKNDVTGYSQDHVTEVPLEALTGIKSASTSAHLETWDKMSFSVAHWFSWPKCQNSATHLLDMLSFLNRYGLVFLNDMPHLGQQESSSERGVNEIGSIIGPLRDSLYGRTWDVKSVVNAKNIAYTHQKLGLHMDLLYMTSPPSFQILHCLQASPSGGGESTFVDAFHAAKILLKDSANPSQHPLCTYQVPYHYHHVDTNTSLHSSHYYRNSHPVIELDGDQRVVNVNWSPPFQAPLDPNSANIRTWHREAQNFSDLIEDPAMQFDHLLQPGEAVIFNNRRVLHARRAFDVEKGPRWLKGAYIDGDSIWSKLRVLHELLGKD
ncbi:MAG: hypothetical protein M1820_008531 [Bogoriella megaspora]|nr:MAG: hypothetical protein M1820_008531 [Bogoriella megaspora]